jgi:DNA-binding LacI/PurR family transcriptional regulator
LAELGHRNIAWISLARSVHDYAGNPSPEDATWRARCLVNLAAQEDMNCSVISAGLAKPFWQMTREQVIADLSIALRPALVGLHGVTALCCYNDLVALAVLRILRERKVAVPDDVSVIGFDNQLSDIADPALTTIDHCLVDIGRRAGEIAMDYINDPSAPDRYRSHRENVPARLVIRGSTGKAAIAQPG